MSSWRIGCSTSCRTTRTDIALTADHFKLDRAQAARGSSPPSIDGFRKNETEMPGVSNTVIDLLDRGWHYATLFFGETQIRTGHLLVGGAEVARAAARAAPTLSKEFAKINVDALADEHRTIWAELGGGEPAADGRLGPARRRHAGRRRGAAGPQRHDRARPLLAGPDRQGASRARWTRSSAATRRSARSSTC